MSGVINIAKQLRADQPQRYGQPRAAKGSPGYIPQGWKNAIIDASEIYKQRRADPSVFREPSHKPIRMLMILLELDNGCFQYWIVKRIQEPYKFCSPSNNKQFESSDVR